jgi:hypothetical protein
VEDGDSSSMEITADPDLMDTSVSFSNARYALSFYLSWFHGLVITWLHGFCDFFAVDGV